MNSNKTSVSQRILSLLLGLVLSAFGVFHSVRGYPGAENFARFAAALPNLGAVASFTLGIVVTLVGLLLLLTSTLGLRRLRLLHPPQQEMSLFPEVRRPLDDRELPIRRKVPVRSEVADPNGYRGEEGMSGYPVGYRGDRENDEYEERRWAGTNR